MAEKLQSRFPDSSKNGADSLTDNSFAEERPLSRANNRASIPYSVLAETVTEYLYEMEFGGNSKRTLEGRKDILLKFCWWMRREKLDGCSRVEVKRFLHYVANAHTNPHGRWDGALACKPGRRALYFKPVSDRTVQLYFVYLKGYFDYLVGEELATGSPASGMKQPHAARNSPPPLNIETDVVALDVAAGRGRAPKRDEAILYLLLDTGIRVSELIGIKYKDIDWDNGTISVLGKGKKKRQVPFERDCRKAIKAYLKAAPCDDEDYLIRSEGGHTPGEGMTRQGIGQIIARLKKRAGITGKQVSPHVFRHTFGTEMSRGLAHPRALQMMLGHSTLDTTMRYSQLAEADTKNQHRAASPARLLRAAAKEAK